MKIKVSLIITSFQWEEKSYAIVTPSVSDDYNTWKPLETEVDCDEQPMAAAKRLFHQHANASANWSDLQALDVVKHDGDLYCIYYTRWPVEHIKSKFLLDVSYINKDSAFYPILLKVLRLTAA